MNAAAPTFAREDSRFLAPVITTFGIVVFLFFIDEGYYNMKWMLDGGAWVVFFIYYIILFPIQLGISEWILRKVKGPKKWVVMLLLVIPLTIIMLMSLFYYIGA